MSVNEKMTAIADNIRAKTGSSEKLSLDGMAAGIDAVYESGKTDEWNDFWNDYQNEGKRKSYNYAFFGAYWTNTIFKPKYNIVATSDGSNMFYNCPISDLTSILKAQGVTLDISGITTAHRVFAYSQITHIPAITLPPVSNINQMFYSCTRLIEIEELVVNEANGFTDAFKSCSALTKLIVSGTIAKNGFSVSNSTKLSVESLLSILNALKDYSGDTSGTTWKVTLGTTNLSKLTETEKQNAEEKGWTLA